MSVVRFYLPRLVSQPTTLHHGDIAHLLLCVSCLIDKSYNRIDKHNKFVTSHIEETRYSILL